MQTINYGSAPNDGTGDSLRDAFIKVVANDAEVSDRANTNNITIVSVYNQSNTVLIMANGAFIQANSVNITAIASFAHANDAYITAQGAFARANSAGGGGGGNAFLTVNTPANNITATSNVDVLKVRGGTNILITGNTGNNTLFITQDQTTEIAAFAKANTACTQSDFAGAQANSAWARANTSTQLAFKTANTPANNLTAISNADTLIIRGGNFIQITGNTANNTLIIQDDITTQVAAFAKANTACTQSDTAGTQANLAYGKANTACTQSDQAGTNANNAYGQANTAITDANAAGAQANIAYGKANTACTQSDFAGLQANSAWARANTSTQLAFKTANTPANNLIATSNQDTLIIRGGNDILITGNTGNNTLIISNDQTTEIAAFAKANAAYTTAGAAFDRANSANGGAPSTSIGGGGFYSGNNGDTGNTAGGAGLGDIFRVHSNTLSANVTIYSGNNAIAAGPLTISGNKVLTIQLGARVSIV